MPTFTLTAIHEGGWTDDDLPVVHILPIDDTPNKIAARINKEFGCRIAWAKGMEVTVAGPMKLIFESREPLRGERKYLGEIGE